MPNLTIEKLYMLNISASIKNIIFDFGGVICNIDFNKTFDAFSKLGFRNLNNLFSKARQSALLDEFEKGNISPAVFRKEILAIARIDISTKDFDTAWNAMILDIPAKRIKLIENLKTNYRIFLLSNTNKIHYDYYLKNFQDKFNYEDFSALFEQAYFSFFISMKKPDAEIFNYVLNENQLIPSETLFIDDSPQHIAGAKKLGITNYHLIDEDICDLNYNATMV